MAISLRIERCQKLEPEILKINPPNLFENKMSTKQILRSENILQKYGESLARKTGTIILLFEALIIWIESHYLLSIYSLNHWNIR